LIGLTAESTDGMDRRLQGSGAILAAEQVKKTVAKLTFVEVGTALLRIREGKLYRQNYKTFKGLLQGAAGR
jgi:hypothetical protein